jgi:O-antigen/teichoic acid export membrane protein
VQIIKKGIFDPVLGFQIFSVLRYSFLFITAIALAHSGISLKAIGLYETMLLVSGMFSFFYTGAITTKLLSCNGKDKFVQYKIAFIILLFISALIATLMFLLREYFSNLLTLGDDAYFKYFSWFVFFNAPGFLLEYFFLLEKKIKALLVYVILYGLSYILIASGLAFSNYGIENVFSGLIVLAAVRFLVLTILIFRKKSESFSLKEVLYFCTSAFSLLISLLLSGSADYIDSFLAVNYFGQEQLAIFKYGAKELPLSLMLANALSNAMVPVLSSSKDFSQTVSELKRKTLSLMKIVFPASIVLMFLAKWFYPLIFSSKFADSALIFCIYLLLVCSRVLFPQTLLLAKGYYKKIATASAVELVINLSASIVLMKCFGIAGIAMGTVIAFMAEKLILFYYLKKNVETKLSDIVPVKEYLIFSFLLMASFCFVIFF